MARAIISLPTPDSPSIKIGEELDATHYDPASKRLVANMGSGKDGTDLIVLDVPSLKRVGTIKVTAKKPEHAEADGKGGFFLASRDESKVYRLDTTAMKVTAVPNNQTNLSDERNVVVIRCQTIGPIPPQNGS